MDLPPDFSHVLVTMVDESDQVGRGRAMIQELLQDLAEIDCAPVKPGSGKIKLE